MKNHENGSSGLLEPLISFSVIFQSRMSLLLRFVKRGRPFLERSRLQTVSPIPCVLHTTFSAMLTVGSGVLLDVFVSVIFDTKYN